MVLRIIVAGTMAQILQVLMVAKHPERHYLVPSLTFVAFNAGCIVRHSRLLPARYHTWAASGAVVFFLFLCSNLLRFNDSIFELKKKRDDALTVNAMVGELTHETRIFYYCASSPAYALSFGNSYALNRYGELLTHVYGKTYFYDPWSGAYRDFLREVKHENIAMKSGQSFIFQGYSFESVMGALGGCKPAQNIEKILEMSGEAVYRVSGRELRESRASEEK